MINCFLNIKTSNKASEKVGFERIIDNLEPENKQKNNKKTTI